MRFMLVSYFMILLTGASFAFFGDPLSLKNFSENYAKVQGSLFTGFLTAGSFLLSLKSFIIFKIHSDIYKHEKYIEKFNKAKKKDGEHILDPLERLSRALMLTIFSALTASVSQVTIGFIWPMEGSVICASLAGGAFFLIIFCWYLLYANMKHWFDFTKNQSTPSTNPKSK